MLFCWVIFNRFVYSFFFSSFFHFSFIFQAVGCFLLICSSVFLFFYAAYSFYSIFHSISYVRYLCVLIYKCYSCVLCLFFFLFFFSFLFLLRFFLFCFYSFLFFDCFVPFRSSWHDIYLAVKTILLLLFNMLLPSECVWSGAYLVHFSHFCFFCSTKSLLPTRCQLFQSHRYTLVFCHSVRWWCKCIIWFRFECTHKTISWRIDSVVVEFAFGSFLSAKCKGRGRCGSVFVR